jgi:hypothetical protein
LWREGKRLTKTVPGTSGPNHDQQALFDFISSFDILFSSFLIFLILPTGLLFAAGFPPGVSFHHVTFDGIWSTYLDDTAACRRPRQCSHSRYQSSCRQALLDMEHS